MFDRLRKNTRRVGMIGIGIVSNIAYRWNFPVLEREMTAQSRQYLPEAKRKGIPALARAGERMLQPSADGVGDLFHRRYWIDIIGAEKSAEVIMRHIQRHPNQFIPQELATFRKTKTSPGIVSKICSGAARESQHAIIIVSGFWPVSAKSRNRSCCLGKAPLTKER